MLFTIEVEYKDSYVLVTVKGKYDHKQAKQGFYQVLDTCYKNNTGRILVDYREQTGRQNMIQRIDYMIFISGAINDLFPREKRNIRVAYLGPKPEDGGDERVNNILRRSDVNIIGTTSEQTATDWLMDRLQEDIA